MNKKILWLGILVIVGAVVAVNLARKKSQSPAELNRVSLRLAWIPGATFTGDYVAKDKGFWREEGLDVTLSPGGFEYDAIKLVAGGADTFGITSGPQLLQARANGAPVVAIGAVIPRSPIGWVAKKESGIKEPKDFFGKKIGAQFGTHTEITMEALCAKLGIALGSFQRIPVKFDPRPFVAGEIDVLPVYIIDQPVDLRRAGLDLNIIDPSDYGVSLAYGNLYFTTEETLKTKPELVAKFLRGAKRGWMFVKSDPTAAAGILSQNVPDAKPDLLEEKLKAMFEFIAKSEKNYLGVFPMSAQAWESTRDILTKYGELKETRPVEEIFTNKFIPQ